MGKTGPLLPQTIPNGPKMAGAIKGYCSRIIGDLRHKIASNWQQLAILSASACLSLFVWSFLKFSSCLCS
jgi:hypothetical protein